MRLISDEDVKDLLLGLDALPWEEQVSELVDRMPTAYDVDAVVRELEAEYEWQADIFHGTLNDDALGQMRAYDNAIRIVKRGGRNEL